MSGQEKGKLSRRTMIASLGAAGAAVVAGSMFHTLQSEASVTTSVYGEGTGEICGCPSYTLQDVSKFATAQQVDDALYHLIGYHPNSVIGGGVFRWNAARLRADHNGGTVFSPTVPYSWADDGNSYLDGIGETNASGLGCFERLDVARVTPEMFGAYGNYNPLTNIGNDDHKALQSALQTGLPVQLQSVYRNHAKELLIVHEGQHINGSSSGVAYGAEPWQHKPVTGIVCTGTGQRYVMTRRLAPETSSEPNDAPLSVCLNIQAEGVKLSHLSVSLYCNYSNLSATNAGDEFDVGILNGCRVEVGLDDVKIMGYWRKASLYVDVTRGTTTAEFTSPDGVVYPQGHVLNGADQMSMSKVICWGGLKGLAILGAKVSSSGNYYDALKNEVLTGNGGRGGVGASDFHAVDCTFYSRDHHSKWRSADPVSPLNYQVEDMDAMPACVAIDGRRGSASQGRIRKIRFTNCRFATIEFARVALDRCYEVMFDNCQNEPRSSNIVYSSSGVDITSSYSSQSTHNYGPYCGKIPSGSAIGTDQVAIIRSNVAPSTAHFPAAITRTEIATVSNGRTVLQALDVQSITSASPIPGSSSNSYGTFTINDDDVLVIDIPTNTFSGMMFLNSNIAAGPSAIIAFRAASSNNFVNLMAGDTNNLNLIANTALTGTTGPDSGVNISTTNGKMYIENRRGSARVYKVHLFF